MLKSKTVSTFYEADINALVLRGLREFEGLDGLRFASGTAKAIIYPTDDVCLNTRGRFFCVDVTGSQV